MRPVEISKPLNTDDMVEVTDQMDVNIFIHTDPDNGEKNIIIRLKQEENFDIGVDVGPLSVKILEHVKASE